MTALIDRVGWTLVHSLWQGGIVWTAFQVATLVLRKSPARSRYLVGCTALAVAVLWPVVTFGRLGIVGAHTAAALPPGRFAASPANSAPLASGAALASPDGLLMVIRSVLPWLVLAWALGALWNAVTWWSAFRSTRKLLAAKSSAAAEALAQRCAVLSQRLGLRRAVHVAESALVDVPSVLGWWKPVIVVPAGVFVGMTSDQIDGILAHELAHVLRQDFPVYVIQSLCDVLFFYHPAIRAISARISQERENACDDLAVAIAEPSVYAEALLRLEEARATRLALAVTGDGRLLQRIERLVGGARPRPAPSMGMVGAMIAYAGLFLIAPYSFAAGSPGEGGSSDPIAFYDTRTEPTPGFRAMSLNEGHRHETIYVAEVPDITLVDMASIQSQESGDRGLLIVKFTDAGRELFKALSAEHVARAPRGAVVREAMVVEGELVSAAVVREAIDSPDMIITGQNNPEWTDRVHALLQALPPLKRGNEPPLITISIGPDGAIKVDGAPVKNSDLQETLRKLSADYPDLTAKIIGDENSELRQLGAVMDACRETGITNFTLQSRN